MKRAILKAAETCDRAVGNDAVDGGGASPLDKGGVVQATRQRTPAPYPLGAGAGLMWGWRSGVDAVDRRGSRLQSVERFSS